MLDCLVVFVACWLYLVLKRRPTGQIKSFIVTEITMSRKIDNTLDALEKNSGLSRDGRAWLIAACDPFHDSDIALAGYPDVCNSATVVQLVKKQLSIAVPTTGNGTVTASSNWDCSIALFPTMVNYSYTNLWAMNNHGVGSGTAIAANSFGGLVCQAGPAGGQLWPNYVNSVTAVTSSSLDCDEYCKGMTRIIGMGFEVVNTTADIQKQGQVIAWRIPNLGTESSVFNALATTPAATLTPRVNVQRVPPANVAEAQLLYGSRSWAAREGAYVVSRQSSTSNPFQLPNYTPVVYSTTDNPSGGVGDNFITINGLGNGMQTAYFSDILAPFDISGVHFTGLSYASTLTVNVRWLIERVPGPQESDLVVLATPSAMYDPLALELYTHCLHGMPPGVMLSENPLGEWFRAALSKVADFAPKIGSALGTVIPGAALVGNLVGGAARIGSNLIPSPKKEKLVVLPNSKSDLAPTSIRVTTVPKSVKPKKKKAAKISLRSKNGRNQYN